MKPTPEMLATLGITREDVLNCTVKELVKQILGNDHDQDDEDFSYSGLETRVNRETQKFIEAKLTDQVSAKCSEVFTPLIESNLADFTLQQTNTWGEKVGRTLTLTEFVVMRVDAFMKEEVDSNGRTAEECRARHDSFYKKGTRVSQAIDRYFEISMKTAMDQVLKDGASILTEGIKKAAEGALGDIHKRLTARVEINN